jgi:hypothetical protein
MELSDEFKAILEMLEHRIEVQAKLQQISTELQYRAVRHDVSKYTFDEFEGFVDLKIVARTYPYGSPEYETTLKGPALGLHFAANSHHPEHYENGFDGMSFMDIIELVCDWKATNEVRSRKKLTEITWEESLVKAQERFKFDDKYLWLIKLIAKELK